MSAIHFETKLFEIGSLTILQLPKEASAKLSSRNIVMVKGSINNYSFQAVLEPDGKGSHWLEVDKAMREAIGVEAGDVVEIEIEPTKEWIEPKVPADIMSGLNSDPKAHAQWTDITPMARWEWIRWIRATDRLETRERRIEVSCSKLRGGARRPCCFNTSMCTVPEVSRSGVLLEPATAAA